MTMIFTPEHIQKIINGTKTETRRICKQDEHCRDEYNNIPNAIYMPSGRRKWRVGQDYAVQPGRGKRGVWYDSKTGEFYEVEDYNHKTLLFAKKCLPLRIKILNIHSEPVRILGHIDALAEGVGSIVEYCLLWDSINKLPGTRWDDNPNVWVIKFEVLRQVEV